jgi:hypothetical protein
MAILNNVPVVEGTTYQFLVSKTGFTYGTIRSGK